MKKLLESESSWKFSWNWGSSFIKKFKKFRRIKKKKMIKLLLIIKYVAHPLTHHFIWFFRILINFQDQKFQTKQKSSIKYFQVVCNTQEPHGYSRLFSTISLFWYFKFALGISKNLLMKINPYWIFFVSV